jgi:expansin (peptidoglycan-binding protein)
VKTTKRFSVKAGICLFAVLTGTHFTTVASAQSTNEDAAMAALHETPKNMFGVECGQSGFRGMSSSVCFPVMDRSLPLTQIMVTHVKETPSEEALLLDMREFAKLSTLKKVVVEEKWIVPGYPDVIGGRGIYKTASGPQMLWMVVHANHKFYVRIEPNRQAKFELWEPDVVSKMFFPGKFMKSEQQVAQ